MNNTTENATENRQADWSIRTKEGRQRVGEDFVVSTLLPLKKVEPGGRVVQKRVFFYILSGFSIFWLCTLGF